MAVVASKIASYAFDDRNIRWYRLGDFEHFVFAMFNVDQPRQIVDFILKFAPNQQIFLHRHLALTNTLVVQGEHRLYEPNGALKEIRPVGSYTSTPPGERIAREVRQRRSGVLQRARQRWHLIRSARRQPQGHRHARHDGLYRGASGTPARLSYPGRKPVGKDG